MERKVKITILIPGRLNSSRLPNKLLLEIEGLPLIEHVRRRAEMNKFGAEVYVVTGDKKIIETVQKYQGKYIKTTKKHLNGTSRCSEAMLHLNSDYYLILQGDEALVLPKHIDQMLSQVHKNPNIEILNLVTNLDNANELNNKNIVKCLLGRDKQIIGLFRKSPLTSKKIVQLKMAKKVLGIFIFNSKTLKKLTDFPAQPLEKSESIEQYKLQELSKTIYTVEADMNYESINNISDFKKVKIRLKKDKVQKALLKKVLQHAKP